jgi:16S rRNA processing protein RimM
MNYILIGKYVNTHGLKGEIRIISDFSYKDKIFIKGMPIYIGNEKILFKINSHRVHKQYNMITLDGINNINDIESLKGSLVYINKEDLKLDDKEFLIEDLIGYDVYINKNLIGKVIEVLKGKANDILVVSDKRILIPYVKDFIININNKTKQIEIKDVKGLI